MEIIFKLPFCVLLDRSSNMGDSFVCAGSGSYFKFVESHVRWWVFGGGSSAGVAGLQMDMCSTFSFGAALLPLATERASLYLCLTVSNYLGDGVWIRKKSNPTDC